MAPGLTSASERRRGPRVAPCDAAWPHVAILRPGQEVVVVNVSCGGVLLESSGRMAPGARAELQLSGVSRRTVRGRIERCQVAGLSPLRYRGAMVFDEQLPLNTSNAHAG